MHKCDNLRVIWYNTWCLPMITSHSHIRKIADSIVHMIADEQPHIVALCEVFDGAQNPLVYEINARLKHPLMVLTTRHGSKWWGKQSSGLLVMYDPIALKSSGLEVDHAEFEPFDKCCSIDCLCTKGMIKLFIKPGSSARDENDKRLQLVFTHMQDADALVMSQSCIKTTKHQLTQTVKSSREHHVPFVIIGDLNIEPFASHKFLHAEHTEPLLITHPGTPTHKSEILDYAIYSPELESKVDVSVVKQSRNPSDHLPILATIQLGTNDSVCRFDHQSIMPRVASAPASISSYVIPFLVVGALLTAVVVITKIVFWNHSRPKEENL